MIVALVALPFLVGSFIFYMVAEYRDGAKGRKNIGNDKHQSR